GVDANPEAIRFARAELARSNLRFEQRLVDDDMTLERAVDKFYSLEVIEHIYRPQGVAMLRNFHRLLLRGGEGPMTTPNYPRAWPLPGWTVHTLGLGPQLPRAPPR